MNIDQAISKLEAGQVIGVPTDTIYGISSLIPYGEKIYEIKHRDKSKKLITMISSIDQLNITDQVLLKKMNEVWPGAVTLIFEYEEEMRSFRIPNEPNLLALLNKLGKPIYTTSANISGEDPVSSREEFHVTFPKLGLVDEDLKCNKSSIPSEIYIYKNGKFERIR